MQRHKLQRDTRHCEDPYLVPGLNHPCNGMYRDEVSASRKWYPTNAGVSINDHAKRDQTNSMVFA